MSVGDAHVLAPSLMRQRCVCSLLQPLIEDRWQDLASSGNSSELSITSVSAAPWHMDQSGSECVPLKLRSFGKSCLRKVHFRNIKLGTGLRGDVKLKLPELQGQYVPGTKSMNQPANVTQDTAPASPKL